MGKKKLTERDLLGYPCTRNGRGRFCETAASPPLLQPFSFVYNVLAWVQAPASYQATFKNEGMGNQRTRTRNAAPLLVSAGSVKLQSIED